MIHFITRLSCLFLFTMTSIAYAGCLSGDCDDGYGVYQYKNGAKYQGNWKKGRKNGYGSYSYAGGDKYQGNWQQGRKHGYGEYIFRNGERYIGNWKNNTRQGYGEFYYVGHVISSYSGNWNKGIREGYGVLTFTDGSKYYSNFKNNEKDGYGVTVKTDGTLLPMKYDPSGKRLHNSFINGIVKQAMSWEEQRKRLSIELNRQLKQNQTNAK